MTSMTQPICNGCARLAELDMTCEAYPKGIPTPILDDTFDHRSPFAGDHGLQFLPGPLAGPVLAAVEEQRRLDERVVLGAPR